MEAPRIDVATPTNTISSSVVFLAPTAAIVLLVGGAVWGVTQLVWIGVGVVLAWIFGALVLLAGLHDNRRRQQDALAAAPSGTIFAGRAFLLPDLGSTGRQVVGTIRFDPSGVHFAPRKRASNETSIAWSAIGSVRLGPMPGKIAVGALELVMHDGTSRRFEIPTYAKLAESLVDASRWIT
jgi:hypothetical protein